MNRLLSLKYRVVMMLRLLILLLIFVNKGEMVGAAKLIPSENKEGGGHTRNVAVIVQTSRFYHNYRHTSNALIHYQVIKKYGKIPDENIILMLADDVAYHSSNPYKGKVILEEMEDMTDPSNHLFDDQVEVDYRGEDVTVDNFMRVLLGQTRNGNPSIHLDSNTNLLIFITGHGGDSFFKFQDDEEILSADFVRIFRKMKSMNRVNDILFIADTCQAFSLAPNKKDVGVVEVPNVYSIGSSLVGQNSYSHHYLSAIGHSVVDRFSYNFHKYIQLEKRWKSMDKISLQQALVSGDHLSYFSMHSNVGFTDLGCWRKFHQVPLSDFYAMKGVYNHKKRKHKNNINDIELLPSTSKQNSITNFPSPKDSGENVAHKTFDSQLYDTKENQQCSNNFCNATLATQSTEQGMHPSDFPFLFAFGSFCLLIRVSSRKW